MENITGANYGKTKRAYKDFEIKKIEEYIMTCMFNVIHYCQLMYLRTFQICVLKYMSLILQNFFQLLNYDDK